MASVAPSSKFSTDINSPAAARHALGASLPTTAPVPAGAPAENLGFVTRRDANSVETLTKEPDEAEIHYLAHTVEEWRYYFDAINSPAFKLSFTVNHAQGRSSKSVPPETAPVVGSGYAARTRAPKFLLIRRRPRDARARLCKLVPVR